MRCSIRKVPTLPSVKTVCFEFNIQKSRIKNSSTVSLVQDFNKNPCRAVDNVNSPNSGFVAEASGESVCSNSTNVNVPLIRKPSLSQSIATTMAPMRSDFSPASAMSVRPSEQIGMEQHAILNQLTTFHMHSHSSYTQANGHIVNFVTTTTSQSQYGIISPLQGTYLGMMVETSTFPTRYADLSASEARFSNLQLVGNPWCTMPMRSDTSAASLSRSAPQPSPPYAHHRNYY
ncbi:PREDICTED: heat shock transcription factor, Y-linked-like [Odobenus rosmarus divergens]|uniref:Heat shock transcription factor, Y-linked-like n=1 Tax=Odobenus rosmarus divergens TaxID=9708 RepID=A0A2U3WGN7_ODORO|nr:PREDICTED: heat shock transcription factor, Y-linked-like [Odobenus rosmarus divergens]